MFAARGYRAASLKDIAEAVGITPAGVYNYFPSKKALFIEAFQDAQELMFAAVPRILDEGSGMLDQFCGLLEYMSNIFREDQALSAFVHAAQIDAMRYPELDEARHDHRWPQLYRTMAETGVAHGEISEADAHLIPGIFGTIVLGLGALAVDSTPSKHTERINAIMRVLLGELIRPPRRSDRFVTPSHESQAGTVKLSDSVRTDVGPAKSI